MTPKTIIGTLTGTGVECPAMISDDDQLYSLLGDIKNFKPGQRIKVDIRAFVEISYCRQGQTIEIKNITAAPPNDENK